MAYTPGRVRACVPRVRLGGGGCSGRLSGIVGIQLVRFWSSVLPLRCRQVAHQRASRFVRHGVDGYAVTTDYDALNRVPRRTYPDETYEAHGDNWHRRDDRRLRWLSLALSRQSTLTLYRGYDAELGRWVSQDPSGLQGGLNLFRYADNKPARFNDRLASRFGSVRERRSRRTVRAITRTSGTTVTDHVAEWDRRAAVPREGRKRTRADKSREATASRKSF